MSHPHQFSSPVYPTPPPPSPRQNKVVMQRQYREKEGECFNALRDIIKQLTGEELQTRHEILTKAIDLLSSVSEVRRQEQAPYEIPVTPVTNPMGMTSTSFDHLAQPPCWPLQNAEFDGQSTYYIPQSHDQPYHSMPNMDSTLGENWSHDPYF